MKRLLFSTLICVLFSSITYSQLPSWPLVTSFPQTGAVNNTTATTITLRGANGWRTTGTAIKATIAIASTTTQTLAHGYAKGLELTLNAIPGEAGQMIAQTAKQKGLKGLKNSILSNDATNAAIDSIYYAKEALMGNTAYTEWAKGLNRGAKAELEEALTNGLTTSQIEEALAADPTGAAALALIAAALA